MDYISLNPDEVRTSELLQIVEQGEAYRFRFLHATRHERHHAAQSRPAHEHAHSVYHIVLYRDGNTCFSFNGRRCRARRGTLVLAGPGEAHSFAACEPGSLAYAEVTFVLECDGVSLAIPVQELLSRYAGRHLPAKPMPAEILSAHAVENILATIDTLVDHLVRGKGMASMCAMMDLLSAMIEMIWPDGHTEAASPLVRVRDAIEHRFRERLYVDDLAAQASMSKGYFCRAFKKEFGLSPIAYQLSLRARAAGNLLRTTNLLSKEIAARVGFSDEYQFSKAFKKSTGVSPRQFREGDQS